MTALITKRGVEGDSIQELHSMLLYAKVMSRLAWLKAASFSSSRVDIAVIGQTTETKHGARLYKPRHARQVLQWRNRLVYSEAVFHRDGSVTLRTVPTKKSKPNWWPDRQLFSQARWRRLMTALHYRSFALGGSMTIAARPSVGNPRLITSPAIFNFTGVYRFSC